MDAKIDYLSFTLPVNLSGAGHSDHIYDEINWALEGRILTGFRNLLTMGNPTINKPRGRYGTGLRWEANNVNLWWGGSANHTLIEVSGVGCQLLRDSNTLLETVHCVQDRCTRLDIAADIVTPTTPREFVTKKLDNRFPITEQHDTETGKTQYAGSRKSDRYARVYVYQPPHPRAGVLRVEHVLRSKFAKVGSAQLLNDGLPMLVSRLGNTFGWQHPDWKPDNVTDGKLRVQRHDKTDAGTLRWAIRAVAPALAKMHRNGLISIDDFIENHVRPLLDE